MLAPAAAAATAAAVPRGLAAVRLDGSATGTSGFGEGTVPTGAAKAAGRGAVEDVAVVAAAAAAGLSLIHI